MDHFRIDDVDKFDKMFALIDADKPVEVYKNLHKDCWSVRQGGKVRFHTDYIILKLAQFKVGEKGRLRVLREQCKNVHAFVKGFLCRSKEANSHTTLETEWNTITYNPYKGDAFINKDGERKIFSADFVDMYTGASNQVIAANV